MLLYADQLSSSRLAKTVDIAVQQISRTVFKLVWLYQINLKTLKECCITEIFSSPCQYHSRKPSLTIFFIAAEASNVWSLDVDRRLLRRWALSLVPHGRLLSSWTHSLWVSVSSINVTVGSREHCSCTFCHWADIMWRQSNGVTYWNGTLLNQIARWH